MKELSDEKLAGNYRQTGDQIYFEEIHRRWCDRLIRHANTLLKSQPGIAREPIVNAAFTALDAYCRSTQAIRPIAPWLYLAVQLRCRETIRHNGRKKRGGGFVRIELGDMVDTSATPDEIVEKRDTIKCLRKAVSDLPADVAGAIKLVYLIGRTLEGAAKEEGVSLATIKRRVRTGLDLLQTALT